MAIELPSIEPIDENAFEGRVWLLVDKHSYSNAAVVAALMQDLDIATIMGEETADLPTGPNTTLLHWSTPEPADEQRQTHTDMIQQLAARMHVLVTALGSTNGARERVSA